MHTAAATTGAAGARGKSVMTGRMQLVLCRSVGILHAMRCPSLATSVESAPSTLEYGG